MTFVILSLGCNMGDRLSLMRQMQEQVFSILSPPFSASDLMETEPLGMPFGAQWFYNSVVSGYWTQDARTLLARCLDIENNLGRIRNAVSRDRPADVDILVFGSEVVNEENLKLPHPGMLNRKFCLHGCAQIAGNERHPLDNRTFLEIFKSIKGEVACQKIKVINNKLEMV